MKQRSIFLFLILLLLISGACYGQTDDSGPNYTVGMPVNGTFQMNSFDSVQMNTGNLHIEIPLYSIPQRNGLPLWIKEVYDSQAVPPGFNITSPIPGIDAGYNECGLPYEEGGNATVWAIFIPDIVDGSGTAHEMANTGCPSGNPSLEANEYAADGSGWSVNYVPDHFVSVVDEHGTGIYCTPLLDQYGEPYFSCAYEDSNGNQLISLDAVYEAGSFVDGTPISTTINLPTPKLSSPNIVFSGFVQEAPFTGYDSKAAISYSDTNGTTQTINLTFSPVPYYSLTDISNPLPLGCLTSLIFPDGTGYSFAYTQDGLAELKTATLPTGGTITYTYGPTVSPTGVVSTYNTSLHQRILDSGATWTYDLATVGTSGISSVIDPLQQKTIYNFTPLYAFDSDDALHETMRTYYDGSGQLLKKITTTYNVAPSDGYGGVFVNVVPIRSDTTLYPSNQVSSIETDYGSMPSLGNTLYFVNNPTAKRYYDFGSGTRGGLIESETFSYQQDPAQGILFLKTGHQIAGGLNEAWAYDDYSSSALVPMNGVFGHDDVNFSATNTIRGNMTSHSVWDSSNNVWDTTKYSYDTLGNKRSEVDARNNTTLYRYDDRSDGVCTPVSNSYAYLASTTNALGQEQWATYNYCTGLVTKMQNANDIAAGRGTSHTYDSMLEPWNITYPDGGSVQYDYSEYPLAIGTSKASSPSPNLLSANLYDTYGREISEVIGLSASSALAPSPSYSSSASRVDTSYDQLGRSSRKGNPYNPTISGTNSPGVAYAYDAFNQKIYQVQQDGSTQYWCYDGQINPYVTTCPGNASSIVNGSWVNSWDEQGRISQQVYNALGEVVATMETSPTSSSLSLETDYGYDAMGNLTSVMQRGASGDTARARSFTYDSLSRLIRATNPETGQVNYSYDANGNLITKTDARGVQTDYTYDPLNRITQKTYMYAPAGTPSSCYLYDTAINGIGKLAAEWTQSGSCASAPPSTALSQRIFAAYDAMGRILSEQQCTLSKCTNAQPNNLTYQYDLAGNQTLSSNGLHSLAFTNSYDAAGRLNAVTSSWNDTTHPPQLFNVTGYTPAGAIQNMTLGNDISVIRTYDNRLRPVSETAMHP